MLEETTDSAFSEPPRRAGANAEWSRMMFAGYVRSNGGEIPYLSPVRFLPSIMTLLNIRLIRVW